MSSRIEEEKEKLRRALKEGEWACSESRCAAINGESVLYCDECGKSKPRPTNKVGKEIGKEMADKSKGLFAAEDWVCSKCGNVNWARRKTCNVCNAPRLADLERRTGYGGGYMDRQDVEYIKRDYNEDFDEFGRKKKRKGESKSNNDEDAYDDEDEYKDEVTDVKKNKKIKNDEDDEEDGEKKDDDDEEEEDGEDLGKYDFNFDSDPELAEKVENLKSKIIINGGSSICDESECSCSCSGGECSCPESEEEKEKEKEKERKKIHKSSRERDREHNERKRTRSNSRDRNRHKKDRRKTRSRSRDRYRDEKRDRKRSRSRDKRRSRSKSRDRRRNDERRREKDKKRRSRSTDRYSSRR